MKKHIWMSVFALTLVLFALPLLMNKAQAATSSGTCGTNVTWTLDDEGTLTISGTGKMNDYYYSLIGNPVLAPWYTDRNSIKTIVIEDGVTSIGDYAFSLCSNLTSVTIPEGVTSIGNSAFYECSTLTSVTIPSSVTSISDYAFFHCDGLTDVTIPDSVKSIGRGILRGCTGLTSVTISSSITTIANYTFEDCSSLTNVTIPEGVTHIREAVFSGCTSLTSVEIPSSVRYIGAFAFRSCSSLGEVAFEGSAPSVVVNAFTGVTATVYYPEGDTSYTNEVKQNYGGTLTWVEKQPENNFVASGTCGMNVNWTLDSEGTLTISGTGAMADFSDFSQYRSPWYNNRTSIKTIVIEDGVSSIGDYAFYECRSLTSVTIPSSVTSIGDYAFHECSSLTSVTIPSGVTSIGGYAFCYCSSLTSVTIPSSVTSIGYAAFIGCSSLTSVTIPEGVTSIGNYAFGSCSSLTSVTILEGVTSIGNYTFYYCSSLTSVTIPSSVTSIGEMTFSYCRSLTSVTIPPSVTSISEGAFYYCSRLTSVTIPSSVTSIGYAAFIGCSSLTSVTIPSSVTSIGDYAFYGCSSLTSVTIPEGVTSIGECAFNACSSLTSVPIPSSVKSIGNGAFYRCSSLTSVTIPSSVTSIGEMTFSYCSSLTSVTIPSSVTSIGKGAFSYCSSLTSVTIPSSVTSIGEGAFYYCSSLTSVTIPSSVTSVGVDSFAGCGSLTEITFEGSAPSIGSTAFSNVIATVYYPEGDTSYTNEVKQNYGGTLTWVEKQLGCKHANTENHNEQAATCKDVGYTAGVYCTDCEQYISGHDEIPVSNVHGYGAWVKIDENQHSKTCAVCEDVVTESHEWNDGDVTTDPTHFADGEKTFTCAKCGATKTEVLTMIAHTFDQQKAEQDYFATEASCTQKATYYYSCICGAKGTDVFEFGKIAEHSFSIYQYNNDANCQKDGTETSKCDFCDATDTRTKQGSRTEHIEDDAWHTNENGHYHICKKCESALEVLKHTPGAAATCTTDQICTVCHEVLVEKLGHKPGEAATCTNDQTCTVCRTVLNEKLGHQLNDVQFDKDGHWQTCQRCGDKTVVEKHRDVVSVEDGKFVHGCECGFRTVEEVSNEIECTGSDSVALPADVITSLLDTEEGGVTIDFGGGMMVEYDKEALESIANAIGAENVTLAAGKVEMDASDLSEEQKQVLANVAENSALFSISLEANGVEIHNFEGGKATITMPFELPADWSANEVKVYRVEEDGTKIPMETQYKDGKVTWVTDGHSYYLATKAEATSNEPEPASNNMLLIGIGAGFAAVAIVAVIVILTKKKKH